MSDTSALDYLLCHGFDFNKQLKSGLEYFKVSKSCAYTSLIW